MVISGVPPQLRSALPIMQNVYVNISRIVSVGNRLLESSHYASQQIKQISGQLELEWKAFAAALDERSSLLEMSAVFHQKADQVTLRSLHSLAAAVFSSSHVAIPFFLWHFLTFLLTFSGLLACSLIPVAAAANIWVVLHYQMFSVIVDCSTAGHSD